MSDDTLRPCKGCGKMIPKVKYRPRCYACWYSLQPSDFKIRADD